MSQDLESAEPGECHDDPVRESYERCYALGDFGALFYQLFFMQSPEIPPLFANTNFVEQKRHLRASLLTLIKHHDDNQVTTRLLQKLGNSHSKRARNIRPDLYPHFAAALREAIKRSDTQWSSELEESWMQRIAPGIALMISLYEASPPADQHSRAMRELE